MVDVLVICMSSLSLAAAEPSSAPPPASKPVRRIVTGTFPQWCARKWTVDDGLPDKRIERILLDARGLVFVATPKGAAVLDGKRFKPVDKTPDLGAKSPLPADLPGVVPWLPATCFAKADPGGLWVGTPRGLCRWDGRRWRTYQSGCWLPNNHVNDVVLDRDGSAWAATDGGVARIFTRPMTLDQKADVYQQALRKYHVWRGLVKEIYLPHPGSLDDYKQPSSDNDGLWTALYVASEAFRYAATHRPDAKANATESMNALLFLEEVTSLPGFVARSYVPAGEGKRVGDGIWYPSKDGKWDFKGDTSSDELDGHFFAYGVYYDLVDDEQVRQRVAAAARRVMDHIINGGFKYYGPNHRRTRWGVWAPEELNHSANWFFERGLNSLELLSYLKVAYHVTGDQKYQRVARDLIDKHHYAKNTVNQKIAVPGETNHSDDELAFVAYYNLVRLEKDPELHRIYLKSLERSWQIERPEHGPFFNVIYGSAVTGGFDLPVCVEWFEDYPLDLFRWTVDNTHRRDVQVNTARDRFGHAQGIDVLPPSERPMMRWNGNPYELKGGSGGRAKDDGVAWLLPYWMARYHGFIVPEAGTAKNN